jgi:hypothetical protein
MEVSGQFHAPAALPPGERVPDTHWIGSWVDPRVSLDAVEKRDLAVLGIEPKPSRPWPVIMTTELS